MNIGIDIDDTLTDVKKYKKQKFVMQANQNPVMFHFIQKSGYLRSLYH